MELRVVVGVTLVLALGWVGVKVEAGSKAAICNKYPPLVGFEMDRVSQRIEIKMEELHICDFLI
jgi:hypothetical protein